MEDGLVGLHLDPTETPQPTEEAWQRHRDNICAFVSSRNRPSDPDYRTRKRLLG
jgi:hypothetical protein